MYFGHIIVVINADAIMLLLQIVSCSKCRYKYELVSGDIVSIESEEIRLVSFHLINFFQVAFVPHGIFLIGFALDCYLGFFAVT